MAGRAAKLKWRKEIVMKTRNECWVDVPETDGRVQVSNRGNLRVMGRKMRIGNKIRMMFLNQMRGVVCDFKTKELGWWIFFDGENHFYRRDDLMELFDEALRDVDRSRDEEAVRLCKEQFRTIGDGSEGGKSEAGT